jgi:uncharacterized protein YbaP (TraB family)
VASAIPSEKGLTAMSWPFSTKEKSLTMLWKVTKGDQVSYLAGTVHFFPYSFRHSMKALMRQVDRVAVEGPLDEASMARVVEHGTQGDPRLLLEALDGATVEKIERLMGCSGKTGSVAKSPLVLLVNQRPPQTLAERFEGMRPWMAFFQIWQQFIRPRGWTYSMDLDAYQIAGKLGKKIVFLENIEEQLEALDGIPLERIVSFLKGMDQWESHLEQHVSYYLRGELDQWPFMTLGFPTRCASVLDRRDPILLERLLPLLEKGKSFILVGIPHVRTLKPLLIQEGYEVRQQLP